MTDEEKQELEALRQEKHQRIQHQRAQEALENAGISIVFASLLIGSDDNETDAKTALFCTAYQQALAENIKSRLPQQAPVTVSPTPQKIRRGIQRIR